MVQKFGFKKTYTTLLIIVTSIAFLSPIIILNIQPIPNTTPAMAVFKNIVYLFSDVIMGLCVAG